MLVDARSLSDGVVLDADLCIIGAGAAGITLALEFAGSPVRVILLESGGLEFESNTQGLYDGRASDGLPYFPLDVTRLRYFGGSTNHWGRLCRPFDAFDFERREWIPWSGWPLRLADLEPYYGPAGEICGLVSEDFDASSWDRRDGLDPLPLGDRTEPRIAQLVDVEKRSFAPRYRDEIESAKNVEAYLHANVTEIETDAAGAVATGLRVATLEGTRFRVEAGRFVLAVGGIENPRILLASNRQQPSGVGNRYDLVGRFFTEHPRFEAAVVAPADTSLSVGFYEPHRVDGVEIEGYVAVPKAVQREEEMVDVQVFVQPRSTPRSRRRSSRRRSTRCGTWLVGDGSIGDFGANLMTVVGDLTTFRDYTIPGAPLPVPYPEVVAEAVESPEDFRGHIPGLFGSAAAEGYKSVQGSAPLQSLTLVTRLDQAPNPDSRVSLSAARDELGMPRGALDWRLSAVDRHSAAAAVDILSSAFGAADLGRVRATFDEEASGWPDDLQGGNHHMGTTRMSDDPKQGVVDRDCRIHGMENLFVAGSSVFVTGGSSTPTLTIVALALRLADHLKRDLG